MVSEAFYDRLSEGEVRNKVTAQRNTRGRRNTCEKGCLDDVDIRFDVSRVIHPSSFEGSSTCKCFIPYVFTPLVTNLLSATCQLEASVGAVAPPRLPSSSYQRSLLTTAPRFSCHDTCLHLTHVIPGAENGRTHPANRTQSQRKYLLGRCARQSKDNSSKNLNTLAQFV